jgi:hypothetical protein
MTELPDETYDVPGEEALAEPEEYTAPPTDDDGPQDDVTEDLG